MKEWYVQDATHFAMLVDGRWPYRDIQRMMTIGHVLIQPDLGEVMRESYAIAALYEANPKAMKNIPCWIYIDAFEHLLRGRGAFRLAEFSEKYWPDFFRFMFGRALMNFPDWIIDTEIDIARDLSRQGDPSCADNLFYALLLDPDLPMQTMSMNDILVWLGRVPRVAKDNIVRITDVTRRYEYPPRWSEYRRTGPPLDQLMEFVSPNFMIPPDVASRFAESSRVEAALDRAAVQIIDAAERAVDEHMPDILREAGAVAADVCAELGIDPDVKQICMQTARKAVALLRFDQAYNWIAGKTAGLFDIMPAPKKKALPWRKK